MQFVKLEDVTRPYNEEFDMYRRIIYQAGEYPIKCLISFPDSIVEYSAEIPGGVIKVSASAYKKEPLSFSLDNADCFLTNTVAGLDKFLTELNKTRQIYGIIHEIDSKYNTLKEIDGSWTKEKTEGVKAYV